MRTTLSLGALFLVATACGGGGDGPDGPSGVDPSMRVTELSPDDSIAFCEWMIEAQGGAGHTQDCGGGLDVTVNTVEECIESFNGETCGVTVGEIEECIFAIDGDSCALLTEPRCEVFFDCA